MSQQSVYNLLKKSKKWLSAKEIAKKLGLNSSVISQNLLRLKKNKSVKWKNKVNPLTGIAYYIYRI